MRDLLLRYTAAQKVADDKTRTVCIGQNKDPVFLGKTANQRALFAVVENPKTVCRYDRCIQNGRQLLLIVLALYNHRAIQCDHRLILSI